MKKIILGIMVFGLVGLICGSARGQTAENIIKLKKSGNCKGCFLEKANLEGANLEGYRGDFFCRNFLKSFLFFASI